MRRILTEIKLEKVAAVDNPACEGARALILKRKPKQVDEDPDDDNVVDDWSVNAPRKKPSRKKIKGWDREAIDEVNQVNKQRKPKHPFEQLIDNLANGHGIPKYMAMAHARRQAPQSYRHYQQQGVAASQSKVKKAAPDDEVIAWDQAVRTWGETHGGVDRCTSMSEIRKQAPQLWARFRRKQ